MTIQYDTNPRNLSTMAVRGRLVDSSIMCNECHTQICLLFTTTTNCDPLDFRGYLHPQCSLAYPGRTSDTAHATERLQAGRASSLFRSNNLNQDDISLKTIIRAVVVTQINYKRTYTLNDI